MRLKLMIYMMVAFLAYSSGLLAQQRIVLVVNKTLLPQVEAEVIRLKNDLQAEGYSAFIQDWDYDAATFGYSNSVANRTEANKLITYLKQKFDEPASLHGAILIGALPRYYNLTPPNDNRAYKDNAFMNLTSTTKKIWVSRIWGLGNDMADSIAGKEQILIKRALDANHHFRIGQSRYPHKGNLCYSYDIAYASYFAGGAYEIPNIASVWPIHEPTYDVVTPASISNSRITQGSDILTLHAHGGVDNGGQDMTVLNMLEYNPQSRTIFSGWTHFEAGLVGGIASTLLTTRNGGVVLANSGGPFHVSEIYSNSSATFRGNLNAKNSYGQALLKNWVISNSSSVFNGDLTIQAKMFPTNQMPSISTFSADKISGLAPLTVNFSNISALDPDGSISKFEIFSKGFFFGKFTPDYSSSSKPSAFQQIYSLPHRYKARLEVADNYMARATKEIEIAVAPSPASALRVNVGLKYDLLGSSSTHEAYKPDLNWIDSQGQIWLHDQQYSEGTYGYVSRDGVFGTDYNAVAGTENDYLYRTSNFVYTGKVLTYKVPVANGNYQLKLHFRENYVTGPNQRLMDINVNNQTTVTALDIFNEAGGNSIALVKNYNVTVANGILEFGISVNSACTKGYTILNAFEVIPQGYHNISPTATISATGGQAAGNVISGTAPLTLQFASNASDVDGDTLYSQWLFGDNESSFETNPSHRFDLPGTYQVTLQVHDGKGGAVQSQMTINIAAPSDRFHISASVNNSTPNGLISPVGYVNINQGASQTFTMTPFAGYQVSSVLVNGVNIGAVSSYTFTNVTANHSIIVNYQLSSDSIAPSIPTGLFASSITSNSFLFSWNAATDNLGVTGYKIFRNGVQIGTSTSTSFSVTGLSAATSYTMTVSAFDAANNNSVASNALSVTTSTSSDTTAPTIPSVLVASAITTTSFTLSWTASTDAVGVTGYKIFRGGVQIGTSATTSFSVMSLSASTTYLMTVSAYDAAGNNSTVSNALSVTTATPTDTTAPTIPSGLVASAITATSFTLSWTASTDAVGVSGYKIFRGGVQIGTTATTNFAATGLSASTTYSMTVSAYDAAGNNSAVSNALAVTTSASAQFYTITATSDIGGVVSPAGIVSIPSGGGQMFGFNANPGYQLGEVFLDGVSIGVRSSCFVGNVTANRTLHLKMIPIHSTPTIPKNLAASAITANSFTLSWTVSTDTVGVTGYKIFKGGVQIGTSATTSFLVTGLSATTTYSMTVSAYNAAGNNSALSSALSVTTLAASDTTHPTVPTGLVASVITATSFTLSWAASTDAVGVTGYKIFKGGVQIGTSATTSFAVTGLSASTAYAMTVSAYDAAGNNSAVSSALAVTTMAVPDTTAPTVPTGLVASAITATSFTLSWAASTDAVGVTGYKVFKGGVQIGASATTSFAVTGLSASTTYVMTVSAYDAASNNSAVSSALSVTTLAASDTTAPTVPSGLIASAITATTFTLSWSASTDAVGVTGYKVFKGGVQIGTSATTSFAVTGLSASTTYVMTVLAYDAASNNSAVSSALSVTTSSSTLVITASAGANGSISPTGTVSVNSGSNQTFTISPAVGFQVNTVLVDGVSVGAVSSYTFSNITTSHSISASFKIKTLTITATSDANGTITPSGIIPIDYGGSRFFSMAPASGYQVSDVLVNGISYGARWNLFLGNVTADQTVHVKIQPIVQLNTISAIGTSDSFVIDSTNIKSGQKQTYILAPTQGFKISKILVDGEDAKSFGGSTFSTIEMIIEPNEINSKQFGDENDLSVDKKYSDSGVSLVNISRKVGSEGSLGIRFEATRYTSTDETEQTLMNDVLIWDEGDTSDKTINSASISEGLDEVAVYSVKLTSINADNLESSIAPIMVEDSPNSSDNSNASSASSSGGGGCNYAVNMSTETQIGNLIFMFGFVLVMFVNRRMKKIKMN